MNTRMIFLLAALVAAAGPSCSSRQVYDSAIGWRTHECQKLLDESERRRCLEGANTSYDDYRKAKGGDGSY